MKHCGNSKENIQNIVVKSDLINCGHESTFNLSAQQDVFLTKICVSHVSKHLITIYLRR